MQSIEQFLNKIKPYLNDLISDLKKSNRRKIQLTTAINFTSCKDTDEEHVLHSKKYNIETMIIVNLDEVIEELFQSLLSKYKFF